MSRRKLLILVDWFMPGYKAGGPIQSCVNLCHALKNHYEIFVLTSDTDHGETEPYPNIPAGKWLTDIFPGIAVCYLEKRKLSPAQILARIKEVNADVIYLNHLFSPLFVVYPLWLKCTGKISSSVVVCPRGALYKSALSVKSFKKVPLLWVYKALGLSKKVAFHATNERESAAIKTYFPASAITIADNLPNVNQPAFESVEKQAGELHCIFIARIVPIKNLLFLLRLLPGAAGKITITIVGPPEDESYWQQCQAEIDSLPGNIVVHIKGAIPNQELPGLIKDHHLFILPTTGENFGHAIFEALINGRPVLISDQTPWLNLRVSGAGWDLPLDNQEQFVGVINQVVQYDQQQFDQLARKSWEFAGNYLHNQAALQQYQKLFL